MQASLGDSRAPPDEAMCSNGHFGKAGATTRLGRKQPDASDRFRPTIKLAT